MNKKHYYLDFIGLSIIGIFCLGYVFFDRPFAEMHVQLPFLDFPVFIGEILLFLCLIVFLLKGDLKFNKKYSWIIGYFVFIIAKALVGYFKFGPLAFRDAAMFYYPAFIILANSFYRKEYFDAKKNILFITFILFLINLRGFNEYWLVTYFILAFILSYTYPRKIFKYVLLAALFLVTPYRLFFSTSRMMMVANFSSGVYMVVSLYLILKIKKSIKVAVVVLSLFSIVWAIYSFSDRNALLGIVRGGKIIEIFRSYDKQIGEIRHKSLLEENNESTATNRVRIYNPDPGLNFSRLGQGTLALTKASSASDNKTKSPMDSSYASTMNINTKAQKLSNLRIYNPYPPINLDRLGWKKEVRIYNHDPPINLDRLGWKKEGPVSAPEIEITPAQRSVEGAYNNAVFRLFIWRDMLAELMKEKPILGFHFGKPLRSISLETLHWGETEWGRDGWIAAHNSYLNIIYRAGIVGLASICAIFMILFKMIKRSVIHRSLVGILLCGIIINWFVAANFLLILELPYTAIPIWTLFGLTYAYVGTLDHLRPLGVGSENEAKV